MFAIVCVSENWGIGKDGQLLFHIKDDLKRFRELTLDKSVVMGRKTLESLPGGKDADLASVRKHTWSFAISAHICASMSQ